MRCNDCNKFVSYDAEGDPEVSLDVSSDGNVSGTVRIVNTCQECGSELKETTFDVDVDFSDDITAHRDESEKGEHNDLSVDTDGGSRTDRRETKTKDGRPIKPRYQKQFYGAEMTITVTCQCGETFEKSWSDECQASGMDELQ